MEKAEKYYKLLVKIKELTQELQWGEGVIPHDAEKKRLFNVIYAYRELGEHDNCCKLLERYIDRGETDLEIIDVYIRMKEINGRYLMRKNDVVGALENFETALKIAEKNDIDFKKLDLYQSISTVYEKIGDYKKALEYYERFTYLSNEVYKEKNCAYSKYLIDVYGLENIEQETRDLMERNKALGKRANMDSLTGIYNRRYLHEVVTDDTMENSQDAEWGMVMLDVDFFKQYNDYYGHDEGDKVLRTIGAILKKVNDERIFPVRYGGEEFLLIIKNPRPGEDIALAERIVTELQMQRIPHEKSTAAEYVTMSAGAATGKCRNADERYQLIEEADKRLYVSKRTGRNKVTGD